MTFRSAHLAAMVIAAVMPLAAWSAEPIQKQARQLYLDFAQAPTTGPDDSLQAGIERLKAQKVHRPSVTAATQEALVASAPSATAPAREILSSETIEALKLIPPSQQQNLLAAADALFDGGHLPQARAMYETLMGQNPPAATRAWVLYQLGNCMRGVDPRGAAALYDQVIKDHADCPWAQAAQASARLLEWKQASAVQELLDSSLQISLQLTAPPASRPAEPTSQEHEQDNE
ncbi:MAG: hypothetical protein ABFD92_04345 [Planctomycetaceae bacterium]|nr:hypothetical protein [Planctomycetaceae bacterium]